MGILYHGIVRGDLNQLTILIEHRKLVSEGDVLVLGIREPITSHEGSIGARLVGDRQNALVVRKREVAKARNGRGHSSCLAFDHVPYYSVWIGQVNSGGMLSVQVVHVLNPCYI